MRRLARVLCVVMAGLACCTWAPAQTTATSDGREADHEALRALIPLYEQAVNQEKLELLKPYVDPTFTGVMVTSDQVNSFESLEAYWKRIRTLIGEPGKYTVKLQLADKSIMSGDLAVAHGTTQERVVTATGNTFEWTGQWTAALRKVGDQWKVLRVHGSMDPVNNAFVSGAVRGWSWLWGLIGVAGGTVLGLIGASLLARRKRA